MTRHLSTRQKGIALAAVTAIVSGFAVFINGYGVRAWLEVADATTYTTLKNLVSALVIGVFATLLTLRRSREAPRLPSSAGSRWTLALLAIVGGSVPFVLFFEGLSRAASAQAAFIHKTLIIWVAFMAIVFLKERLSWPHVVAIGVLVWGQIVLLGGVAGATFGVGEAMILGATLLWSVEVVVAKKLLADVPSATVASARMIGGSVVLVTWALVRSANVDWAAVTGTQLVWVLATGFVLSAYVLTWFAALERAPAVDVTAVLVAGAVITALLQTSIRGVALPDVWGLVLLIVGSGLAAAASWRAGRGEVDSGIRA
ncbi:MAG: DMT family transporter [Actinomycetota bacterium]|nr:DMT family transporter [Actinomycetota bacterium]